MRSILITLVLSINSIYGFCQTSVHSKIVSLNKEMEEAFNANNMQKVSNFYVDSALISGGGMNVTGRQNIDKYWMSFNASSAKWRLEVDNVEDYGNIVIQRGRSYLSFTRDGSERQSNVRFVLIWKKEGDRYRIIYDLFGRL